MRCLHLQVFDQICPNRWHLWLLADLDNVLKPPKQEERLTRLHFKHDRTLNI